MALVASLLTGCDYYMERPAEGDAGVVIVYVEREASVVESDASTDDAATDAPDAGDASTGTTYSIGGAVSGLTASGLVIQNKGGDDLPLPINGTFAFATNVTIGTTFAVSIKTQPAGQTCAVSGGSGTVTSGNVTTVNVNCAANRFTLSGTVSGLEGQGLVLENNGANDLAINAVGGFAFGGSATAGTPYAVTVRNQPSIPTQHCDVANGTGTMPSANVSNVAVTCQTRTFAIGGTVSGLEGSGLVLQSGGGDDLAVGADGTFVFTTPVLSGKPFAVSIKTQPSGPSQLCSLSGATGTVGGAAVTSVLVDCSISKFALSGTASGVAGAGLVLQNNGGDDRLITANGTFAFSKTLDSGAAYAVTVKTQPTGPSQFCSIANGSGFVGAGPVANVVLSCTTNTYLVGGSVNGLVGTGLVVQNGGDDDLLVGAGSTSFAFPTRIESSDPYAVTVKSQPTNPSQTCSVTRPAGLVVASDVNDVAIDCSTNAYSVSGTVAGLSAGESVVFELNGGQTKTMSANGAFTFAGKVASGATYAVTVSTHPTGKYCAVANGSDVIGGADITNVALSCGDMPWATAYLATPWAAPNSATKRTAFVFAPAGTGFGSNADYASYCTSHGFAQNQNSIPGGELQSAGMVNATDFYCATACCFLGDGNGQAGYLTDFQNFGLPVGTKLEVFDRGCGDYGGSFNTGLVTVDALTATSNTTFSYAPSYYGNADYGQAKSTVLATDGVIVCQEP